MPPNVRKRMRVAEHRRADDLFEGGLRASVLPLDRLLAGVMVSEWVVVRAFDPRCGATIAVGTMLTLGAALLALARPARPATRMILASAQMVWVALLVHLTGGRIEMHFGFFASLALLALYRDWRVFLPATLIVVAYHLLAWLGGLDSARGLATPTPGWFFEHLGWIACAEACLVIACIRGEREMRQAAERQANLETAEQGEYEVQLAASIQASILPREIRVAGLEVAAKMLPAAEVGGDYYDVLPVAGGCIIGIGDVAGHGLKAGLTMLQTQSAVEALVRSNPQSTPAAVLTELNRILFDRSHKRRGSREHVTMSLLRYHDDGRIVTAGAHQEAILWRAATGRCERLSVQGTWLGMIEDIEAATVEATHHLGKGDLLVLYTDGVIEATNASDVELGLERLCATVEAVAHLPVADVCDHVFDSVVDWSDGELQDDATLVVLRHLGVAGAVAAA